MTFEVKIDQLFPRTVPCEITYQRVLPLLPLIPITRLANLTPLDTIGVPVWSCVTPKAKDLTTHLGKGLTDLAAKVSALMEAVERISAEKHQPNIVSLAAHDLEGDGQLICQPPTFLTTGEHFSKKSTQIDWSRGEDLYSGDHYYSPTDYVVSPSRQTGPTQADTNGLASGNTILEASVHAILEVIERDVVSQHLFADCFLNSSDLPPTRQRVNQDSLPDHLFPIVEAIRAASLELTIDFLSNDIGIPVFSVMLIDYSFVSDGATNSRCFFGFGAASNSTLALLRALTEAIQSRLAVIQGARDTINKLPIQGRLKAWYRDITAHHQVSFDSLPSLVSQSVDDDLMWLKHKLSSIGLRQIIRFDLTDPVFDIPVVRIRIPGLSNFVVNQRDVNERCYRYLL